MYVQFIYVRENCCVECCAVVYRRTTIMLDGMKSAWRHQIGFPLCYERDVRISFSSQNDGYLSTRTMHKGATNEEGVISCTINDIKTFGYIQKIF
jgi:hypothetical protein